MGSKIFVMVAFLLILVENKNIGASDNTHNRDEETKPISLNPLETIIFNHSSQNVSSYSKDYTGKTISRVKRQYGYYRDHYYPIPIFVGGIGYPAFGPRGFAQRGYGGRGFGGRGFGGRGFAGRGFGGRGIGGRGIGGRGGIGGGRGGRG